MCNLCNCPCFPSSYECLLQYAPELKPLPITTFNALIDRVKLTFLLDLLGPKCLTQLCEAIKTARQTATTAGQPKEYQQYLPSKWQTILQSEYFQQAYALAIYREYIQTASHTVTNDGIVQIYRETTNQSLTIDSSTKHIDRNLRNDITNNLTKQISQAQQILVETIIKPISSQFQDCQLTCAPCTTCNPTNDCNTPPLLPYQKPKKLTFA